MTVRLAVRELDVEYRRDRARVHAVDTVSFDVEAGEILAVVGESGSGKTTIARCVAGELRGYGGRIQLNGVDLRPARTRAQRCAIQLVHQDPRSALTPHMTVGTMLRELLLVNKTVPRSEVEQRCRDLMADVWLDPGILDATPVRLSGGQRQRVAIARSLAVGPAVLVADEPTSALDVTVQSAILNMLIELRERLGLSIVFISHDLAVVHAVADRVAVMRDGRVVEIGRADSVLTAPSDPYTRELLLAAPRLPGTESAHPIRG